MSAAFTTIHAGPGDGGQPNPAPATAAHGEARVAPLTFMSVNTQFDNVGDAIINRELAKALASRTETRVDLSRCPESFARALDLESISGIRILRRFGYARLIGAMFAARLRGRQCIFFLNPGGLGGALRARKVVGLAVNNLLFFLLFIAGVRLALVGVSFDPMDRKERLLWGWRIAMLRTFWVRDRTSVDTLARYGISAHDIAPDLSFTLDTAPVADRSDIAFSFRFDKGHGAAKAATYAFVAAVVAAHPERRFRFIAQVGRDVAPMTALFEHVHGWIGKRASLHVVTDDITACLTAHAGCAAIYSNRLHAALAAVHRGVAPCAVLVRGATNKFEGIFADLGISDQLHWLEDGRSPPTHLPRTVAPDRLRAQVSLLNGKFDALLGPLS